MGKNLSFADAREKQLKAAYDWADCEMKPLFSENQLVVNFTEDHLEFDENVCEIAMFYDKENDRAILRRLWPKKLAMSYNVVMNYDEIKHVAPNTLKKLLDKGIEVYMRNGEIKNTVPEPKKETTAGKGRKILSFDDAKEKELKEAFDWAVRDQKRNGFKSVVARFEFHGEDILEYDENKVEIAMFYNKDQDWAIFRRDWLKERKTLYNLITNYDEIERVASGSLKKLLDNGVKMYKRYKKAGLAD